VSSFCHTCDTDRVFHWCGFACNAPAVRERETLCHIWDKDEMNGLRGEEILLVMVTCPMMVETVHELLVTSAQDTMVL